MTRKRIDPKRAKLLELQDKLRADFERNYVRLRRAFTRMEKCRQALARVAKRLAALDAQNG
jgi:hypothetical protein